MTRANQTTGLTNGRAAKWAPEVEFRPFCVLSRCQMTFLFCCQQPILFSGGLGERRKSGLSKNVLFPNWPKEGLTLIVMSTNFGYLGSRIGSYFLTKTFEVKRMWCYSGYFLREKMCIWSKYLSLNDYDKKNWSTSHVNVDVLFQRTYYFIQISQKRNLFQFSGQNLICSSVERCYWQNRTVSYLQGTTVVEWVK